MEKRKNSYTISKPQLLQTAQEAQPSPAKAVAPQPANAPRPLSDIRELSEPSIIDSVVRRPIHPYERSLSAQRQVPTKRPDSPKRSNSARSAHFVHDGAPRRPPPIGDGSSSYSSTPPEQSSFYSIPYSSIPRRSSSQTHAQRPVKTHARKRSIREIQPPAQPKFDGFTVPNRGQSRSPVKQAAVRADAVNSDAARRVPSQTYIRTPCPADILEFPSYRHPRVRLELRVSAPLFVGGGSIEGQVMVIIDGSERARSRRSLAIGPLSVDLLGFEDMPSGRRAPFLAVGTELIDTSHPPPANMIEPPNPLTPDEDFWMLTPSTSALPFMISLPLDTGPPPFQSKIANIRFLLCATALVIDAGKHYRVRTSQDVSVLATYDPEKALASLASPLTARDELSLPRFGRIETMRVTAGLHRQVWVSGTSIFVDVHIVNKTHKAVKRLELSLERDILCYKHAPAGTGEKSASQARIFESNEQTMIARLSLKPGQQGWNGVQASSSDLRTHELELPRGHATVRCGKYFEVRFFLNITASLSNTKLVTVQLPLILIHMNSLDVLPNAVAQVAAAIEEKRAQSELQRQRSRHPERSHARQRSASSPAAMAELRKRPSYTQGRAFAAPRQQSTNRLRAMKNDIDDLRETLDSSPRKFGVRIDEEAKGIKKMASSFSVGGLSITDSKSSSPVVNAAPHSRRVYDTPPAMRGNGATRPAGNGKADQGRKLLPRMQSVDSMWSKTSRSIMHGRPPPLFRKPVPAAAADYRQQQQQQQNVKPQYNFTVVQKRIDPHMLGLSASGRHFGMDGNGDQYSRQEQRLQQEGSMRPSTALGWGDKMEGRKRFEFRGVVARKGSGNGSGGLKERGRGWLEQVGFREREMRGEREREREGWI